MISSIHVAGYRGFEQFDMSGLSRVNLLVGTNGSGKTSMLEALYVLSSSGDPDSLWTLLQRRGEELPLPAASPDAVPRSGQEFDISHLFTGHKATLGSTAAISATNQALRRSVTLSIVEWNGAADVAADESDSRPPRVGLRIASHPDSGDSVLPLTRGGGVRFLALAQRSRGQEPAPLPAQFITTDSLRARELVSLWDSVALTRNEELVLRALQIIAPDIERIAAQMSGSYGARGGFIVKSRLKDAPVPIGSMGDGMWRLLGMAIAITRCAGGMLLVDEIDTGLHYSVMADMWRLVLRAAIDLDAQVFATSHSLDCIRSLAEVCTNEAGAKGQVTLQRIEPGRTKAVPYTASEITQAATRDIEVR